MKSPTYLNWHLGLGDAFICTGLVRTLLGEGETLLLPAHPHNADSIQSLFSDYVNFQVLPVARPIDDWREVRALCEKLEIRYLGLGLKTNKKFPDRPWELEFYDQAGIPEIHRWSRFWVPEIWRSIDYNVAPYAFVHDDPVRGYNITKLDTKLPARHPNPAHEITHASRLMANATEIHVIDSSFMNLAEGMHARGWLKATRYVYHSYARQGFPPKGLRIPWEIIS